MLIDLDELDFSGKEATRESMRDKYRGTPFESIVIKLDSYDLFDWFDVLAENRDKITDLENVIGTKDLELSGIISESEFIRVLAESDKAEWNDPMVFISVYCLALAEIIENEFESDEEFITYLREEIGVSERGEEQLVELQEEMSEAESEKPGMMDLFVRKDFNSDLAKRLSFVGGMLGMISVGSKWDKEPEIGQYLVWGVSKPDHEVEGTYYVAVKVVEKNEEPIMLDEVVEEEVSEEDNVQVDLYTTVEVETIAYEPEVLELYPAHFLVNEDPNETSEVGPQREPEFEIYDESPLPLDELSRPMNDPKAILDRFEDVPEELQENPEEITGDDIVVDEDEE